MTDGKSHSVRYMKALSKQLVRVTLSTPLSLSLIHIFISVLECPRIDVITGNSTPASRSIEADVCLRAVSYTHLDVYKRQDLDIEAYFDTVNHDKLIIMA